MERKNKFGIVSKEQAEKIIEDRKKGLSYRELSNKHNISKWWCTKHLINIKPDRSWLEDQWKSAESEAEKVLINNGYKHIINLNQICASPYWDYYAEKDNQKWLFDVTINSQKDVVDKGLRTVSGYHHAILLKKDQEWIMLKVNIKKVEIK